MLNLQPTRNFPRLDVILGYDNYEHDASASTQKYHGNIKDHRTHNDLISTYHYLLLLYKSKMNKFDKREFKTSWFSKFNKTEIKMWLESTNGTRRSVRLIN